MIKELFMKWAIYSIVICSFLQTNAQNSVKDLSLHEIKVGELMPDVPLGEVTNNYMGKTRFSEFKGKLIILDFWNTVCSSCIASFPKMSKLQKEFGDKIQIFLVNFETQAQIDSNMFRRGKNSFSKKNFIPENLISITGDKYIEKLFPPKGETGYHVWINGDGMVMLRGPGHENTYEEKIQDALLGKKVSYITDEGLSAFKRNKPLYTVINRSKIPIIQYSSLFAKFNSELAAYFGDEVTNRKDSGMGTIRNTYLNYTVYDLYKEATQKDMDENGLLLGKLTRLLLLVKDTVKYTNSHYWYHGPITDKIYTENRFSYEQIIPENIPDAQRRQYMLEDLNRYFGALYGAEGKIEKQKMSCYLLVRTSGQDKLRSKGIDNDARGKDMVVIVNGKKMLNQLNLPFGMVLGNYFSGFVTTYLSDHIGTGFLSINDIIIDETGYMGNVDIQLPDYGDIKDMEELRKALKVYDLDIIKGEREVKMLVIKEKG